MTAASDHGSPVGTSPPRPRRSLRPQSLDVTAGVGLAAVVSALIAAQAIHDQGVVWGAVLVLLRASGPVFVTLFTVVLLQLYKRVRGRAGLRFWLTSMAAAALTYVAWSAASFATDGAGPGSPLAATGRFWQELLSGSAHPQLRLVFLAAQLCAVTPLVRRVITGTRRAHLVVLIVSGVLQAAVTFFHWPGSLLVSWILFVVLGALLVDRQEEARRWMRRHPSLLVTCAAGGILVAGVGAGAGIWSRRLTAEWAGQMGQAGLAVAALIALAAAGVRWGAPHRGDREIAPEGGWSDEAPARSLLVARLGQAALALIYVAPLIGVKPPLPWAGAAAIGLGCGAPLLLAACWLVMTRPRPRPLRVRSTEHKRVAAPKPLPLRPLSHGRGGVPQPVRPVEAIAESSPPHLEPVALEVAGPPLALGIQSRPRETKRPVRTSSTVGAVMAILVVVAAVAVGTMSPRAFAKLGPAVASLPTPIPETVASVPPVAPATTTTLHTLTAGGMQRTYEVIEPQEPASTSLPVLVFLHGLGADFTTEEDRDDFTPLASDGQAILIYPAGFEWTWNYGACCDAASDQKVDDIAFLTDVVHAAATIPGVDRDRIFVGGYSNGGRMTYDLICHEPLLAAGAVVIAAVPPTACPRAAPVPLLQVAGDNDPEVPYQGVLTQVSDWVRRDGCTGPAPTGAYVGLTVQRWPGCAQGSSVWLATYAGAGHGPFGGVEEPPVRDVIWAFMQGKPFTG